MYGLLTTLVLSSLAQAATVFLNPSEPLPPRLSPQQARLVLASHLGLESFEVVNQPGRLDHLFQERDFVGQGAPSALLLLVDQAYARDLLPPTLPATFSFSASEPPSSWIETYTQHATHVYTHVVSQPHVASQGVPLALDVFSAPTPANEAFLAESSTLVDYVEHPADRFTSLALTSVPMLAQSYGRSSEPYMRAVQTLRAVIEAALADKVRLAVVAYAPSAKRSPVLGLSVGSGCWGSVSACDEGTDRCSEHGECTNVTRAGQTCFVCACGSTVSDAGKVQQWAGQRCERRDVSGPFVLITGTVITLVLLMGGAVSLLYAIDGHALPSILLGGVAGGGVRRE